MACETSKQAWDKLKKDLDKIMVVVNNIRLLGDQISDFRIVEKVITLEKYESKISFSEDSRDLPIIYLFKLVNVLYALDQRRASK